MLTISLFAADPVAGTETITIEIKKQSEIAFQTRYVNGGVLFRETSGYRYLQCETANNSKISCGCERDYNTGQYYLLGLNDLSDKTPDECTNITDALIPKMNTAYRRPFFVYKYSNKYDGCYFGDNVYPKGKEYLALFDTLDCKMMTYLQYSAASSIPGFLLTSLLAMFYSPIATIFVAIGISVFVYMVAISINILYVFLNTMLYINLLVLITPIIFPTMLIKKYENAFKAWMSNMIGYVLQFIFVIIFSSLFFIVLDKYGVGDVEFVHPVNSISGRMPTIKCVDPTSSVICIFKFDGDSAGSKSAFGPIIGTIFGIGPDVSVVPLWNSSNRDYWAKAINTLIAFFVLTFLLEKLSKEIPGYASDIVGAMIGGKDIGATKDNIHKKMKSAVETGSKVMKYAGKTAFKNIKGAALGGSDSAAGRLRDKVSAKHVLDEPEKPKKKEEGKKEEENKSSLTDDTPSGDPPPNEPPSGAPPPSDTQPPSGDPPPNEPPSGDPPNNPPSKGDNKSSSPSGTDKETTKSLDSGSVENFAAVSYKENEESLALSSEGEVTKSLSEEGVVINKSTVTPPKDIGSTTVMRNFPNPSLRQEQKRQAELLSNGDFDIPRMNALSAKFSHGHGKHISKVEQAKLLIDNGYELSDFTVKKRKK
ncbi:MAG: hypothetical protein LBH46_04290 [Rickettsiales bacterium]|nr:hypothetical protein [Rickettsiales bacterium]